MLDKRAMVALKNVKNRLSSGSGYGRFYSGEGSRLVVIRPPVGGVLLFDASPEWASQHAKEYGLKSNHPLVTGKNSFGYVVHFSLGLDLEGFFKCEAVCMVKNGDTLSLCVDLDKVMKGFHKYRYLNVYEVNSMGTTRKNSKLMCGLVTDLIDKGLIQIDVDIRRAKRGLNVEGRKTVHESQSDLKDFIKMKTGVSLDSGDYYIIATAYEEDDYFKVAFPSLKQDTSIAVQVLPMIKVYQNDETLEKFMSSYNSPRYAHVGRFFEVFYGKLDPVFMEV